MSTSIPLAMSSSSFTPLPGSQSLVTSCRSYEIFYSGTRGNGKSSVILYKLLTKVSRNYGSGCRILVLRKQYKELDDLIEKSKQLFLHFYPTARYNKMEKLWTFPNNATIRFSNMDDYSSLLGMGFLTIFVDELPEVSDQEQYESLKGAIRPSSLHTSTSIPSHEYQILSTGNPYGLGFQWVKSHFITAVGINKTATINNSTRSCFHGTIWENTPLLRAFPNYIHQSFSHLSPAKKLAWVHGSWENPVGGFFYSTFDPSIHIIPPFTIPLSWRIDRTLDYGFSSPCALDYWAVSDGTPYYSSTGTLTPTRAGDTFKIHEHYISSPTSTNTGLRLPTDILAQRIKEQDTYIHSKYSRYPNPGIADIPDIHAQILQQHNIYWKSYAVGRLKSRIQGWQLVESFLNHSYQDTPNLYIFSNCTDLIRTLPIIPHDIKNPLDICTSSEDHLLDSLRYKLMDLYSSNITFNKL